MNFFANKKIYLAIVIVLTIIFCALISSFLPRENKRSDFFVIKNGESLTSISRNLSEAGFFSSESTFKYFFLAFFNGESARTGTYYFRDVNNIFDLGYRIAYGDFEEVPVKITIKEGTNKFEMAEIFEKSLPNFNKNNFLKKAKEGFLFPDTYFFRVDDNEDVVFKTLGETFENKIGKLFEERNIKEDKKIYDIVTLASIVEEEASKPKDRRIIAGILQNRLKINMALQVDVTFQYINGKNTYELTLEDLKDQSLYNTYIHTGLPPTPISSPGLDSVLAVLEPIPNDYLYFLSSRNNVMYYAKTFEEHKKNRERYL